MSKIFIRLALLCVYVLIHHQLPAQVSLDRSVVASAGSQIGSASISLTYTVGESFSKDLSEGSLLITAGFLQFTQSGSNCTGLEAPLNPSSNTSGGIVVVSWEHVGGALGYQVRGGAIGGGTGNSPPLLGEFTTSWTIPTGALTPNTTYLWQVRAACGTIDDPSPTTPFSISDTFTTNSVIKQSETGTYLFPNPAITSFNVSSRIEFDEVDILDLWGRSVFTDKLSEGGANEHVVLLPPHLTGLHYVVLRLNTQEIARLALVIHQ